MQPNLEQRVVRIFPEREIPTVSDRDEAGGRSQPDNEEGSSRDNAISNSSDEVKLEIVPGLRAQAKPEQPEAVPRPLGVYEPRVKTVQTSDEGDESEPSKTVVANTSHTESKHEQDTSSDAIDFLMQDFMSAAPRPSQAQELAWDIQIETRPLSKGSRIAKHATIATLFVSLIGIGSFIAYHKFVVPTPAVLGASSRDIELPQPMHTAETNRVEYGEQMMQATSSTGSKSPQVLLKKTPDAPATTASKSETTARDLKVASASDPGPGKLATFADTSRPQATSDSDSPEPPAAISHSSSDQTRNENLEAEYHKAVEKALALHQRSQRAKAKKEYRHALEINPSGAQALSKLALYALETGKYAEAIELAERATSVDPTSSEGWIVLGAARQATADQKGAMLAYRKCSESSGQYVNECRRLLR
ncbi:MAG: tetratricopeptide repeat protein [Deltaproteobacteria bacterium]|nr:tetratricopeptide repeat protein [Deltaproteobacteria bacterium]